MKAKLTAILALVLSASAFAADNTPPVFPDQKDKISYSLGVNLGNSLKMQGADINLDQMLNGMKDILAGKAKLTEQEVRETIMAWQTDLRNKRMAQSKVEGEKAKKEGDEFLVANLKKEGVKSFPSGLQYKVLASGNGPQPKPTDVVRAHYKGTLLNGEEFDSSYTRGQPLVHAVIGLIPGWQQALTNMHVGDKWQLFIPGNLAYGERGYPPKIPPDATLLFEMELVGIEPPPEATPGPGTTIAPGTAPIRVVPGTSSPAASQPIRVVPPKK